MKQRGKFIVIEGTDGSGKETQSKLLQAKLTANGRQVLVIDFPQYSEPSGQVVKKYLHGAYGTPAQVGAKRASILYAVDRYDAGQKIKQALTAGKIVIANRYVASNMAHQGGKIASSLERHKFFKWLEDLEYGTFKIPYPDLNIILHLPADLGQKLVEKRGKKKDLHETDLNHLLNAAKVYLELAEILPNTKIIKCSRQGTILSREAISQLVWQEVEKII